MGEMQQGGWQWPGGKPIAVIFNVAEFILERDA